MSTGYPHRLLVTRSAAVIYDGGADVQDAGASVPRNTTGQPGQEATATAFLPDESVIPAIEQFDAVTVYSPNGDTQYGEVSGTRELDGVVLLVLDEAGLTHTVIIGTEGTTRDPGGRIIKTVVWAAAVLGRLTPVGGTDTSGADQPTASGQYVLTLPNTVVVTEGQLALVKGHEDDDPTKPVIWQRLVSITKVLLPTRSKDRRQSVLVTDTEPNP